MLLYPRRHTHTSFPLMDLPADVQLMILSNMDLHTLQNVTQAVPDVREIYLSYPSSVLQGTMAEMRPQIHNLLLTTYSLVCTIKFIGVYSRPDLSNMSKFLAENLDTEKTIKIDILEYDALSALHTLCEIDAEVKTLIHDYAKDIYERAYNRDNPGAIPPTFVLSKTETYRMTRAFYRLKLFGVLFYNYADCFDVDLELFYTEFFNRLSTFEVDELFTTYQFALQNRHYFKSAYTHRNCSFVNITRWRDADLFNCECCHGLYNGGVQTQPGFARRRNVRPFWWTLSSERYIEDNGLWAEPVSCQPMPIKIWDDEPEANESNEGWRLWCKVRDNPNWGVQGDAYADQFRSLGYCFWDHTRLEVWGNMFQEDWFGEERGDTDDHSWCRTCEGHCDA